MCDFHIGINYLSLLSLSKTLNSIVIVSSKMIRNHYECCDVCIVDVHCNNSEHDIVPTMSFGHLYQNNHLINTMFQNGYTQASKWLFKQSSNIQINVPQLLSLF